MACRRRSHAPAAGAGEAAARPSVAPAQSATLLPLQLPRQQRERASSVGRHPPRCCCAAAWTPDALRALALQLTGDLMSRLAGCQARAVHARLPPASPAAHRCGWPGGAARWRCSPRRRCAPEVCASVQVGGCQLGRCWSLLHCWQACQSVRQLQSWHPAPWELQHCGPPEQRTLQNTLTTAHRALCCAVKQGKSSSNPSADLRRQHDGGIACSLCRHRLPSPLGDGLLYIVLLQGERIVFCTQVQIANSLNVRSMSSAFCAPKGLPCRAAGVPTALANSPLRL